MKIFLSTWTSPGSESVAKDSVEKYVQGVQHLAAVDHALVANLVVRVSRSSAEKCLLVVVYVKCVTKIEKLCVQGSTQPIIW